MAGDQKHVDPPKEEISPAEALTMETYPCCDVGVWWHQVQSPNASEAEKEEAKEKLLAQIRRDSMAPLYRKAAENFGWKIDNNEIKAMEAKHEEEVQAFDAKIEEARENYGDVEVRDALLNKANFYCRVGDLQRAVSAYTTTYEKTVGSGSRLDITFTLIRLGFVYNDKNLIRKSIVKAQEEMAKGGDWERRNKLKVFEGLEHITMRRFQQASDLFLSVLSTFPSFSLLSFEKFIFYVAILALLCCDRPTLKKEVVLSPPLLEGGDDNVKGLISSYYDGKYRDFMRYLVPIADRINKDIYMGRHYLYLIRSLRLRGYKQFLEPYKSVTVINMANAFGVSSRFIEEEVSSFVASGKLNCRIDKVNNVLESNRPDERSMLYLQTIKQGDQLMNRIQRLARVTSM